MSAKAQHKTSPSQSNERASGPAQGATDFGSNDAMQEAMQADAKGPMTASVIQVAPHGDNDARVLVGKGSLHGVEQGWEVRTGGTYGYVDKVYSPRSHVIIYGETNMDGEKEAPEVGRSVQIYRKPLP